MTAPLKLDDLPSDQRKAKETDFFKALRDISETLDIARSQLKKPTLVNGVNITKILKDCSVKGRKLADFYAPKHPLNAGLSSRISKTYDLHDTFIKFVKYSEAAIPTLTSLKAIKERLKDVGLEVDSPKLNHATEEKIRAIGSVLNPKYNKSK